MNLNNISFDQYLHCCKITNEALKNLTVKIKIQPTDNFCLL